MSHNLSTNSFFQFHYYDLVQRSRISNLNSYNNLGFRIRSSFSPSASRSCVLLWSSARPLLALIYLYRHIIVSVVNWRFIVPISVVCRCTSLLRNIRIVSDWNFLMEGKLPTMIQTTRCWLYASPALVSMPMFLMSHLKTRMRVLMKTSREVSVPSAATEMRIWLEQVS
jgi:hypothetical protein